MELNPGPLALARASDFALAFELKSFDLDRAPKPHRAVMFAGVSFFKVNHPLPHALSKHYCSVIEANSPTHTFSVNILNQLINIKIILGYVTS